VVRLRRVDHGAHAVQLVLDEDRVVPFLDRTSPGFNLFNTRVFFCTDALRNLSASEHSSP
jgi:hypothetical protein